MKGDAWFESADGLRSLDTIRLPGFTYPEVWQRSCRRFPKHDFASEAQLPVVSIRTYKLTGERAHGAPIYRELHP